MSQAANKKKHKPSLFQLSFFIFFQGAQKISYKWGALLAYHFWFYPGRAALKHIPNFQPENTRTSQFNITGKTIRYWSAGQGPSILLVHGWAGCGSQFAMIAETLISTGYRVTWFDAPAHGQSSGYQTNLFEITECILKLETESGPFDAVIAHSFGVPCSLAAINQGLLINKFIAISSPASARVLLHKFCHGIRAHEKTQIQMVNRFHKQFSDDVFERISAHTLASKTQVPSLVIHDRDDPIIPADDGKTLQQNLIQSTLLITEGLGHNRILRDPKVTQHCVDFISA